MLHPSEVELSNLKEWSIYQWREWIEKRLNHQDEIVSSGKDSDPQDLFISLYREARGTKDEEKIREASCELLKERLGRNLNDIDFIHGIADIVREVEPNKYNDLPLLLGPLTEIVKEERFKKIGRKEGGILHTRLLTILSASKKPMPSFDVWYNNLLDDKNYALAYEGVLNCEDAPEIARAFWMVFSPFQSNKDVETRTLKYLLEITKLYMNSADKWKRVKEYILDKKPSDVFLSTTEESVFNEYGVHKE